MKEISTCSTKSQTIIINYLCVMYYSSIFFSVGHNSCSKFTNIFVMQVVAHAWNIGNVWPTGILWGDVCIIKGLYGLVI